MPTTSTPLLTVRDHVLRHPVRVMGDVIDDANAAQGSGGRDGWTRKHSKTHRRQHADSTVDVVTNVHELQVAAVSRLRTAAATGSSKSAGAVPNT